MVVDLFGKIYEGTFIGDNLATAVATRTGVGAVIHGGIRDMMGIRELKAINVFYRGVDPTPIRHVTLAGLNIPVRLGAATVLPGDVVFGTPSGVIFIPPHLAERAASLSRETRLRDKFGKQRLAERTYTSADLDVPEWRSDIQADYNSWLADGTQEGDGGASIVGCARGASSNPPTLTGSPAHRGLRAAHPGLAVAVSRNTRSWVARGASADLCREPQRHAKPAGPTLRSTCLCKEPQAGDRSRLAPGREP